MHVKIYFCGDACACAVWADQIPVDHRCQAVYVDVLLNLNGKRNV